MGNTISCHYRVQFKLHVYLHAVICTGTSTQISSKLFKKGVQLFTFRNSPYCCIVANGARRLIQYLNTAFMIE
jgi:hypothetical protein